MDEASWERARGARAMLGVVGKSNLDLARPSRLFGCACARLVWHQLSEELGRPSIEMVERFVDGQADWADLRSEFLKIRRDSPPQDPLDRAIYRISVDVLMMFSISAFEAGQVAQQSAELSRLSGGKDLTIPQSGLVREIFGNPFRPETFEADWINSTAVDLARDIDHDRAFERMPILGDSLEEAGCPSPSILDHCRKSTAHVRGCWVVDGVLGLRRTSPRRLPFV